MDWNDQCQYEWGNIFGKNTSDSRRDKKKTPAIQQKSFMSYIGFEPMTHALKGRCSTY